MGLTRSTFYDASPTTLPDDGLLARIGTICDEFECYGYRRVGAALRQQGVVVNGKKLRRLTREHDLQPKRRRRQVVTTDSDHNGLVYPDLAKAVVPDRPNQLWAADLTQILSANSGGRLACVWRCSMSLRPEPIGEVPAETARVARAAFPKAARWSRGCVTSSVPFTRTGISSSSIPPGVGRALRRGGWPWSRCSSSWSISATGRPPMPCAPALTGKYALGLELADPGFHFSALTEFRARLVAGGAEHLLLNRMLERFKARGLVKARGKQRTDSTHVLAAVHDLHLLELVARDAARHLGRLGNGRAGLAARGRPACLVRTVWAPGRGLSLAERPGEA